MITFVTVVSILICVALMGIILLQNPKGGGVNSAILGGGGSSGSFFAAPRAGETLEKVTWYLVIALVAITLGSKFFMRAETAQVPGATQTEFNWEDFNTTSTTTLNPSALSQPTRPEQPALNPVIEPVEPAPPGGLTPGTPEEETP